MKICAAGLRVEGRSSKDRNPIRASVFEAKDSFRTEAFAARSTFYSSRRASEHEAGDRTS